jgi:hypothetical protein
MKVKFRGKQKGKWWREKIGEKKVKHILGKFP